MYGLTDLRIVLVALKRVDTGLLLHITDTDKVSCGIGYLHVKIKLQFLIGYLSILYWVTHHCPYILYTVSTIVIGYLLNLLIEKVLGIPENNWINTQNWLHILSFQLQITKLSLEPLTCIASVNYLLHTQSKLYFIMQCTDFLRKIIIE